MGPGTFGPGAGPAGSGTRSPGSQAPFKKHQRDHVILAPSARTAERNRLRLSLCFTTAHAQHLLALNNCCGEMGPSIAPFAPSHRTVFWSLQLLVMHVQYLVVVAHLNLDW